MIIDEIPFREIKALAKLRLSQSNVHIVYRPPIVDDFLWEGTPEGHEFWALIEDFDDDSSITKDDLKFIMDVYNRTSLSGD